MSRLITILGATASGKTTFAAHLALRLGGEIISADSRQLYRGMDIGTGKDLADYTVGGVPIPYHLVDIVPAGYKYSVFEFQQDFARAYQDIVSRQKQAILCGGTGMYIEAVVQGYGLAEVQPDIALRAQLEQCSMEQLVGKLKDLKQTHNSSDFDSHKRIIRAIEIAMHPQPVRQYTKPQDNVYIGILFDREQRRARITDRLHERLGCGMVQEVQRLLDAGVVPEDLMYYGLEYKYLTLYVTGKMGYDEMVNQLNVAIHQFAKRQMTWFRGMERKGAQIHWIDGLLSLEEKLQVAERVLRK